MDPADGPDTTTPEGVKAALASMGFDDLSLVEVVIAKHGADLDACARDLAAATEWGAAASDAAGKHLGMDPADGPDTTTPEGVKAALASMGFDDLSLVEVVIAKHG